MRRETHTCPLSSLVLTVASVKLCDQVRYVKGLDISEGEVGEAARRFEELKRKPGMKDNLKLKILATHFCPLVFVPSGVCVSLSLPSSRFQEAASPS